MDWFSIHVYYYESDKDALILEAVRPLFRRLAGQVSAVSFTRHWRLGPHLRLNVRTDAATFADVVRPAAEEIIGAFLARRPSSRRLDPEQELPAHRRLAELENDQGPLLPWVPDNTIQVAPYDGREEALGNPESAALISDFLADTTEFVFLLTEQARGPARVATCFNLMVTTAHTWSGKGITSGFVSFRSHAEAFLHGFPEGDGLLPHWDAHYRKNAETLMAWVERVVTALDEGWDDVPFIQDWVRALTPYQEKGERFVRDGFFPMPSGPATSQGMSELSPFHRRLVENPRWEKVERSPEFLVYRLMINFTYLTLTRLGLAPAERLLLCHLAANAVEELYGISAYELVGEGSPR